MSASRLSGRNFAVPAPSMPWITPSSRRDATSTTRMTSHPQSVISARLPSGLMCMRSGFGMPRSAASVAPVPASTTRTVLSSLDPTQISRPSGVTAIPSTDATPSE